MTLTVVNAGGTDTENRAARAAVEQMLRMICSGISVDPRTGAVTMVGPAPGHRSGCSCLAGLLQSNRTVRIKPMKHGTSKPEGLSKPMEKMGGGCITSNNPGSACKNPDGTPGRGSDATVSIDISNRDGQGYPHGYPMWLVLAHELSTGHASHIVTGTAERVRSHEEYSTIVCEHSYLVEDPNLTRRNPNDPKTPLRPEDPVPLYRAPAVEPASEDNDGW